MRLTLRTMLAYLDGILDASDADVLRKKIEDSDFASGLVHRIRGLMRRVKLGAPKLDGRGMGADPNTVAEYLDNVMASDRVPEFEKVCLESDVHLAEVASCHQILTLVLGGAAPIDAGLRERMYRVGMQRLATHDSAVGNDGALVGAGAVLTDGDRMDRSALEDEVEPEAAEVVSAGTITPRSVTNSPDYLPAGQRRVFWPLITTLGFFFLLTIVALRAMGPLNRQHPLYRFLAKSDVNGAAVAQGTPRTGAGSAGADSEPAAEQTGGERAVVDRRDLDRVGAKIAPDDEAPLEPGPDPDAAPLDASASATESSVRRQAADLDSPLPAEPTNEVPESAVPTVPAPEPPDVVGPVNPEPARPAPIRARGEDRTPDTETPSAPPAETPAESEPASSGDARSAVVGRFISDAQVLARLDREGMGWSRVAPESLLQAGDQLLAFPGYRPQVLLVPGIKVTLVGPTRLQATALQEEQIPAAAMPFGRLIVNTDGKINSAIFLEFGTRRGTAVFPDSESAMAVEVMTYLPPGNDPVMGPTQLVISIYATRGKIVWREEAGDPIELATGDVRVSIDQSPAEVYPTSLPDWVEAKAMNPIDLRAARDLEQLLPLDRPLELSLREKAEHRQAEVRALAIRCLSYLDVFEPCVLAFSQDSQHSYWHQHFDAAQAALARGADTVLLFLDACQKQRGADAQLIMRLLEGFSPEQLESGEAKQLVQLLEHKSLDVRVLTLENLRRITSFTKLYRPEKPIEQQKRPLREWKEMLDAGQVNYKTPPSPLPPRKDANPAPPNRTSATRRTPVR